MFISIFDLCLIGTLILASYPAVYMLGRSQGRHAEVVEDIERRPAP